MGLNAETVTALLMLELTGLSAVAVSALFAVVGLQSAVVVVTAEKVTALELTGLSV